MKIIIFAGGSGKRFWPRSRKKSPKQFLDVVDNKPLVRIAFERLLGEFSIKDIFLSTGDRYSEEIKRILPEIPEENLIFEPDMRDTGPAVTLAVSYVHSKFQNDVVGVIWSDQLIKDSSTFIANLKEAESIVKETNKIIFIAVPARYASVNLGYIQFGKEYKQLSNPKIKCLEFKQFEEKPNQDVASQYLKSKSYCWNIGYWVFNAEAFLNKVSKTNKEIFLVCQEVIKNNFSQESKDKFSKLEKISADYIFAEKVFPSEALVLLTEIGWSDVGEWLSLKEALEEKPEANVIKGNVLDMDSKDSIIHNYEKEKLVATIGLNGFVVVNTKDVVAVFHKNDSVRLKEFLKKFEGTELEKYL